MTQSEENYLKSIYHLSMHSPNGVSTNSIAEKLNSKPSSVTDMLKKLSEKDLVSYQKYQGVSLTAKGKLAAVMIIRKHRLWEVFLVDKLGFSWDEVHDIAEELEHIKSDELVNKLDAFLGFPEFDPHGDSIPNENGVIKKIEKQLLSEANFDCLYQCVGVKNSSTDFLKYLDKQKIKLGSIIKIREKESFDNSLTIQIDGREVLVSHKIASNLFVKKR